MRGRPSGALRLANLACSRQHALTGNPVSYSFASHQVPLPDAKTDDEANAYLERWLKSYEADKFFDLSEENIKNGSIFKQDLYKAIPKDQEKRMGFIKETYDAYKPLDLADWQEFGYEKDKDEVRYARIPFSRLLRHSG